ncbi:carbamoyl-phosphate synthase large subunit [Sneathiella sp. P13V-1]|uniref:carboxyl transferase domain-containing protein n=1 Tax=Sneathiella sp. P13V-1 TaxID=2697366 RepID=UPI00187B26DE|nr:carboxyl transferase domain-containing protein [Sneathiella sp. P13V-1]MBE7638197.1 carbamoyl-phosphate synthase large subunit [Sneathiella sp. P13V-1]
MSKPTLLIANRGEIAIRIAQTARSMGWQTVAISPEDDANSLHVRRLDNHILLPGAGPKAYLNISEVIKAAKEAGASAIHPGYGFLSENPVFAKACVEQDITFIGPSSEVLATMADKSQARALAIQCGVPVLAGRNEETSLEEATHFFQELEEGSRMFIKAVAGGGGRGMRLVSSVGEIEEAYSSAGREADASFGDGRVYVERFMPNARHIEVQVLGDGKKSVHLFDRDCSLQRRNQKIIEIAPASGLSPELRENLFKASIKMAEAVGYRGLGTFEFLVEAGQDNFAFLEANPRIQVEHTVTEEILGLDLVEMQIRVCGGESLNDLGVEFEELSPQGAAMQLRINAEEFADDGSLKIPAGQITSFETPGGRGMRIDGSAYIGWKANPRYDTLLAKLIVHVGNNNTARLADQAIRALADCRVGGIGTNIPFLQAVLESEGARTGQTHTRYVDDNMAELLKAMPVLEQVESVMAAEEATVAAEHVPEGHVTIPTSLTGTVVEMLVQEGEKIHKGQIVAILEAMKMEHQIEAAVSGEVTALVAAPGDTINEGQSLLHLLPQDVAKRDGAEETDIDPDYIRPDLAELLAKRDAILDEARGEAVAKRHAKGKNTVRENLALLVDEGSLSEYGGLNLAAQRSRFDVETLEKISPADGMVAGTASVNGDLFAEDRAACVVLGYDYTVFAGTQGMMNHKKTDRMLHLAEARQLPIIFYGEGGGGRPGDVDVSAASTLDVPTFQTYARLSGLVPRIGVASGRCFAGNAALMGVSDLLIATKDTSLGMGGPAMIEGGGLGVFTPEEVGPVSDQGPNGVIDVITEDETEATEVARKLLSYFQGAVSDFDCADQRLLKSVIPENRLRVYDIRQVIELLADTGSVQEIRPDYAKGMITAFVRIGGRPMGLIANNPKHLGGAIDADGSEKAARHLQLCDAFDIPVLTLCDTPGFMVGPDAEKTALVRKTARLFAAAGSLTVPIFTVILRKGYGLGAQAMGGGSMHAPFLTLSWPTGEMGPMGLEGAVRLGFKKELAAIEDLQEREKAFQKMVDAAYVRGKAVNAAAFMEIDDVIDPATTRDRIIQGLKAVALPAPRRGRKRTFVDTW